MRKATLCFLAAALLLIGLGQWKEELAVVLSKGTKLCLECVGIG